MATSREPSAPPSSLGSTISDPEQEEQKPQPMELDGDEGVDSPLPEQITPQKTPFSRRSGMGSRGAKRGQGRRSKGTPRKSGHVWIQEGPQDGTEDEGSVASAYQKPGWSQRRSRSPRGSDADAKQATVGTAIGTRRQANGTIGSVYSGNKIRHIKKEDGTPLWRKDIQHEFLKLVVDDTTPVFTRVSDGKKNCNFADIYIDAMARSSKTSKILKDRLQTDREAAQNMAMICLLVNVGRMNTTLNFFPEMRAQLRTYHSIPSLQSYKSQRDYKSLQDAPRLKSILKGASEDDPNEPRSIDALKTRSVPRTNPVNLIFILSHYAPKISELHFNSSVDFFDLVIRHTISSKSRARAFLWLMWWYLESDFTREAALANPFGPGVHNLNKSDHEQNQIPLKVPNLEFITEEEGNAENVDPSSEQVFAEKMQKERKRLLLETGDGDPENKLLKRIRKSGAFDNDDSMLSDTDSITGRNSIGGRASPSVLASDRHDVKLLASHPSGSVLGGQADSLDDDWEAHDLHPGRGRYKRPRAKGREGIQGTSSSGRILLKSARAQAQDRGTPDTVTPQPHPPGSSHPVLHQFGAHKGRGATDQYYGGSEADGLRVGGRKPRPMTQHQRALENHKKERVEYALALRRRKLLEEEKRKRETGNWLLRAARRVGEAPAGYDSEDEEGDWGLGGLVGQSKITKSKKLEVGGSKEESQDRGRRTPDMEIAREEEDYGEEAESWLRVFKKARSRLEKWSGESDVMAFEARNATMIVHDAAGDDVRVERGMRKAGDGFGVDGAVELDVPIGASSPMIGNVVVEDQAHSSRMAGLDDIDRSLLAERSDEDEDMADDDDESDGIASGEDGGGEESDVEMD
jgi:Ino eighty subunit 1